MPIGSDFGLYGYTVTTGRGPGFGFAGYDHQHDRNFFCEFNYSRAQFYHCQLKRPESLDAWDLYQRGLGRLYQYTEEGLAESQQLFHRARELDSDLGPAYSASAEAYYFGVVYGLSESPDENREQALAAARRAVELDSHDAAAHCTLGRVHYLRREHELAIPELEIALDLNPSYAWAHYGIGAALVFTGRAREAFPHLEHAIRLSPRDPYMGSFLVRMADAHLFLRQYEAAIQWARKALRQPNFQWSRNGSIEHANQYPCPLSSARESRRVQITRASRRSRMSSMLRPSSSRISSVCSPRSGAALRTPPGVRDSR